MTDTTGSIEWNSRILAAGRLFYPKTENGEEFEALLRDRMGFNRDTGCDSLIAAIDDDDVFKFGDFREAFKEHPIALLRMAFKALRGGKVSDKAQTGGPDNPRLQQLREAGFKIKSQDAPTPFLLGLYQPDQPNDPVTQALKARFHDEPVIAFNDDGTVNIQATTEYVSGVEQGFPKSDTVNVGDVLVKLWPVGVKPDVMVEEDPLFPGSPLRNGVSVANYRNWSKVEHKNRQFCRLVLEQGAVDPNNHEAVLRLLERAQNSTLNLAYPDVDLLFREKAKRDDLPKLKIELGKQTKPQHPFGVRRQY